MDIDDGGPVFGLFKKCGEVAISEGGLSRRDWFATFAPEPSKETIEYAAEADRMANPHGDSYKPPRRGIAEIITDYKFRYADAMIAASKKTS